MRRPARWEWVGTAVVLAPIPAHWLLPDSTVFLVGFHSFFGWIWIGALVVALLAWRLRSPALATGAAALTLGWLAAVTPGNHTTPTGKADFRVVSANVLTSNHDMKAALADIVAADADVILLQEYSNRWHLGMSRLNAYPHRIEEVRTDAFGMAIVSKRPLTKARTVEAEGVPWIEANTEIDGVSVRLVTVHAMPPVSARAHWMWVAQLRQLLALMQTQAGATVIAGDLNLTRHSPTFRELLAAGFHTAHAECGRSALRTWPTALPIPPLRPDHIFLSEELQCVGLRQTAGFGSDHRGIVADLALRE